MISRFLQYQTKSKYKKKDQLGKGNHDEVLDLDLAYCAASINSTMQMVFIFNGIFFLNINRRPKF